MSGTLTVVIIGAGTGGLCLAHSLRADGIVPALASYERDMIDYGFAAVRASLGDMERFTRKECLHAQ